MWIFCKSTGLSCGKYYRSPTSVGNSPYQSPCSYAGNPYFIDLDELHNIGLLSRAEIDGAIRPRGFVDYGDLYANRMALLRTAWSRWNKNDVDYVKFLEKNEFYDYAVFMALKTVHGGKNWTEWQYKNDLSRYDLDALAEEIDFWQWTQFEFFWEWNRLKSTQIRAESR